MKTYTWYFKKNEWREWIYAVNEGTGKRWKLYKIVKYQKPVQGNF